MAKIIMPFLDAKVIAARDPRPTETTHFDMQSRRYMRIVGEVVFGWNYYLELYEKWQISRNDYLHGDNNVVDIAEVRAMLNMSAEDLIREAFREGWNMRNERDYNSPNGCTWPSEDEAWSRSEVREIIIDNKKRCISCGNETDNFDGSFMRKCRKCFAKEVGLGNIMK